MSSRITYLFKSLAVLVFFTWIGACSKESNKTNSEVIKVSLRNVGHRLLLNNKDSTSLVKPVLALEELKYQLSFEDELSIYPDSLVTLIKNSFYKADLPQFYLVEVIQYEDNEVAYSYEMKQNKEKGIIPCRGRRLQKGHYLIHVRFTKGLVPAKRDSRFLYILGIGVLSLLAFVLYKRKNNSISIASKENYATIGSFQFYPEQHKLIKQALEISLSKKECELLEIFVANPNKIIKRDELMKRVWEDNGVFVGRSLDTYISKLRKKLKGDESIKLTNIHGVGYKLDIN